MLDENVRKGEGSKPHADKSGQEVGESKNKYFCGHPLWTTPNKNHIWLRLG